MSEYVFVEQYRKELESTGYPFTKCHPIRTVSGYNIPLGTIIDASVYYDRPNHPPKLTSIEKVGPVITFLIGDYRGKLDLRNPQEIVELATAHGLFGGILVMDTNQILTLRSWQDGSHNLESAQGFCPRCLEYFPAVGVQRLRTDSGELVSGDVVLASGQGGAFRSSVAPAGFSYVEVHYFGDPTYQMRTETSGYTIPIQFVVCFNAEEESLTLTPGPKQEIQLVACNTKQGNLFEDALMIGSMGSGIIFSLGGL